MSKLVKIKFDNKVIISKSLKISDKLNEIRELLKDKTSKNFVFLFDGSNIDKDDEKNITLEKLLPIKMKFF